MCYKCALPHFSLIWITSYQGGTKDGVARELPLSAGGNYDKGCFRWQVPNDVVLEDQYQPKKINTESK